MNNCHKMVPKPFQNRSWRGSGGHLGATLEARCFQDIIFNDFDSHFGTSLGSFWVSFLLCFFEVAFWWPWRPFGLPKHLQNETQKGAKDTSYQKVEIELSLQPELDPEGCGGAENHHFFDVFLEPCFERALEAHFDDFGSLLGSLLETILVTFWVPFLHRFLDPPKTSKNGGGPLLRPTLIVHALPPPRTPPP